MPPKWTKSQRPTDKVLSDGLPTDVIVPVMGPTGSGKSTLINHYLRAEKAKTSGGYNSCTADVEHFISKLPNGQRVILVDTPGFNDSSENAGEAEILRRIAVWLADSYAKGTKVAGILYLHDISAKRMYGSTRMNLSMFQELCGPAFLSKVVVATTHWDTVPADVSAPREQELKETFLKDVLAQGAQYRRIVKKPDDVDSIVRSIVKNHTKQVATTELQRELVELNTLIPTTKAGKELKYTLKELEELQKQLASDSPDPKKKEEARKKQLLIQQQLKDLKIPFGERLKMFFGL